MGELKRKKSKIETWKPKDPSQIYVEQDDKLLVCHFDEIFHNSKLAVYNRFIIHKESYKNQLELIVNYTNFFINHYDADLELPTAYCKLKFAIDKEKEYDANSIDSFIDFMYLLLFTPTMVDKIRQLVMDNYVDDIEAPYDTKKKYLKSDKKHLESLEFTNQHVRILLAISFSMKIMAAPMFHFIKLNQIDCGKKTTIIFRFFERLFKIFGYGLDYDFFLKDGTLYKSELPGDQVNEQIKAECLIPIRDGYVNKYECYLNDNGKLVEGYYKPNVINMKNKLYVYVKAKVLEANVSNQVMFSQREILGIDLYTVINQFTNRVIISENMVKLKFDHVKLL